MILILTSCNLPLQNDPSATSGKLFTWIDSPLDGSQLTLSPYLITLHANAASGLAEVNLFINDELVANIPVTKSVAYMTTIHQAWEPSKPGIYKIYAQAKDLNGEIGEGESIQVEILAPDSTIISMTPTLTPTPTSSPTPAPSGLLTDLSFDPNKAFWGICGINQIEFSARVANPERIKNLFLFIKLKEIEGNKQTAWNYGYAMNPLQNSGSFVFTLKTASIPESTQFDNAFLVFQLVGTAADGSILDHSPVYDSSILLNRCGIRMPLITLGPILTPHLHLPSPTPTQGVK